MTVEKVHNSKLARDLAQLGYSEVEKLTEEVLYTASVVRTELIQWLLQKFEPKYPELLRELESEGQGEALASVLDAFGFAEYEQAIEFVEARSTSRVQYNLFCELTTAALNALALNSSPVDGEGGSTELDLAIENGSNFLDMIVDGELNSVLVSKHSVFPEGSALMDIIKLNASQSDDSFDSVDELIQEQSRTLQELKAQLSELENIKPEQPEAFERESTMHLASVAQKLTDTLKKFDDIYVNEIYPWVEAFTQNLPPQEKTADFGSALLALDERTTKINELLHNYNTIKHSHSQLAEYWSKHVEINDRLLKQELGTKRLAEMERINTTLRKALERRGLATTST
ncbi:hypothetical protein K493DRAFT_332543 [Basidiobolus meristosporus CBS 931.73]|uniref:Uncharacterized protein n=1 Tax=Basidiobolus meristosporus CBS 931.73 TaxID=1314790 RepID=A0A1Y1ZCK0_9FUNG|nr:hypothetical protein K493DRAFT_332543 [Basidiobolus meristosporus CBS 931.73]|eukprot:ORY08003.1 hypothetical protein K493DRAFT_332543 [Basidiobolus meristosporus CBS 931.73]